MLRKLYYKLSPKLRFAVRYMVYLPYDIINSAINRRNALVPPKRLIFIGSGDFIEIGNLFQKDFIAKNIITPSSAVLDVGCGIGRAAIPMTGYLTTGKYEGFDIVKSGIDWCKKHVSSKFPNFQFRVVDLSNDLYKKSGSAAEEFVFPFEDDSFDLVIVLSVFTHLVKEEVEQYVSEIHRVLKRNGFCYATFFILNESSVKAMMSDNPTFNFQYQFGDYSLLDKEVRSANVAYQENYLVSTLIPKNAFTVASLEYGSWSTGEKSSPIGFQDRIVMRKIR